MTHARLNFHSAATPTGEYIYASGGFNQQALDTIERYSVAEDKWEPVERFHFSRHSHILILLNE